MAQLADVKKILARQVMNESVVTLREDAAVKEAIVTLEEYHISGAPVLTPEGECVGVFLATDILKRRREIDDGEAPRAGDFFSSDPLTQDLDGSFSREDYDPAMLGEDTVGQWMTPGVKSVSPGSTVEDVCRRMVRDRIHRVLVMEGAQLRGIITSFDIVRLVAGGDEPSQPGAKGQKRGPKTARRKAGR